MKSFITLVLLTFVTSGCASLMDIPKKVAGNSRRSLELMKADSIYQVYLSDVPTCFDAVTQIATEAGYIVFMKDSLRGFISLMNVPGVVNTTEVGVFLTQMPQGKGVRVELSSRSSYAKKIVAKFLFDELRIKFKD